MAVNKFVDTPFTLRINIPEGYTLTADDIENLKNKIIAEAMFYSEYNKEQESLKDNKYKDYLSKMDKAWLLTSMIGDMCNTIALNQLKMIQDKKPDSKYIQDRVRTHEERKKSFDQEIKENEDMIIKSFGVNSINDYIEVMGSILEYVSKDYSRVEIKKFLKKINSEYTPAEIDTDNLFSIAQLLETMGRRTKAGNLSVNEQELRHMAKMIKKSVGE